MSNQSLFDRVGTLVEEIGAEKKAAAQEKTGMEDPGGMEGPTSHPSKKPDDDEQNAAEGSQSADNERIVKESIPDNVDQKPEATEGNAPKVSDTQQGTAGLDRDLHIDQQITDSGQLFDSDAKLFSASSVITSNPVGRFGNAH